MSYSVEFYAHTPGAAAAHLRDEGKCYLPATERAKLLDCLKHIQHNSAVYVMARGHVFDIPDSGSSEMSWGEFKVQPIHFVHRVVEVTEAATTPAADIGNLPVTS